MAHFHGKLELSEQSENFPGGVFAPEDQGAPGAVHVHNHSVTVPNVGSPHVGSPHGRQYHVGIQPVGHGIGGVREQAVVVVGIDMRRRRPALTLKKQSALRSWKVPKRPVTARHQPSLSASHSVRISRASPNGGEPSIVACPKTAEEKNHACVSPDRTP